MLRTARSWALVAALLVQSAPAAEYCADTNYCFFNPAMAHYSENDPVLSYAYGVNQLPLGAGDSQLCGPVSTAMAWHGVLLESQGGLQPGSFSSVYINGQPSAYRILALGNYLQTNYYTGTYCYTETAAPYHVRRDAGLGRSANLGQDFRSGGGDVAYWFPYTDSTYYASTLRWKMATQWMWGWYRPVVEWRYGRAYVSYVRNGGHIVPLHGTSNGWLYVYNPWYAMKEWYYLTFRYGGAYPNYTSVLPLNYYRIGQPAMLPGESDVNYPLSGQTTRLLEAHFLFWAW